MDWAYLCSSEGQTVQQAHGRGVEARVLQLVLSESDELVEGIILLLIIMRIMRIMKIIVVAIIARIVAFRL